jgi:hypothetical protein
MRVTRNDAAAIPEIFVKALLEMQLLNAPNALRRTRDAGTVQRGNRRTKDAVASGSIYGRNCATLSSRRFIGVFGTFPSSK